MRNTYKRMVCTYVEYVRTYVGEHVRSGQSQGRRYRAERDADGVSMVHPPLRQRRPKLREEVSTVGYLLSEAGRPDKLSIPSSGQPRVSHWVLLGPALLSVLASLVCSCLREPGSLQTRKRRRRCLEVSASEMLTGNCFHNPAPGREDSGQTLPGALRGY